MSHFPSYVAPVEAAIMNRIISSVQASGLTISVNDGEETTLLASDNRKAIQEASATTDETSYIFYNAERECVGVVLLIHGNGCDLISDCSDNAATDSILADAMAYADTVL